MTLEYLINEGRRIARNSWVLEPYQGGEVCAYWYEYDCDSACSDDESERHLCISVDVNFAFPELKCEERFICIETDQHDLKGRVFYSAKPPEKGMPLTGRLIKPLPPLEAIFCNGDEKIKDWLRNIPWPENARFSEAFPEYELGEAYIKKWASEWPLYQNRLAYAILGGWHMPWSDKDWFELLESRLLVWTLKDAEPWLEVWMKSSGEAVVIPRVT